MVIKKEAAQVIEFITKSGDKAIDISSLNKTAVEALNLSGIIRYPDPAHITLTYGGEIVAKVLQDVQKNISDIDSWKENFK